jgi:hypothetical protein
VVCVAVRHQRIQSVKDPLYGCSGDCRVGKCAHIPVDGKCWTHKRRSDSTRTPFPGRSRSARDFRLKTGTIIKILPAIADLRRPLRASGIARFVITQQSMCPMTPTGTNLRGSLPTIVKSTALAVPDCGEPPEIVKDPFVSNPANSCNIRNRTRRGRRLICVLLK